MLTPIIEKRAAMVRQFNELSAVIQQRTVELQQLQGQQTTLQIAIATLNDTINETEAGLAAAVALCKP